MLANLPDLPITEALPELLEALETNTRAVLEAPPGAGKTTLVPLALLNAAWRADNKILVLEPRRLAARAAAQHMARLLGEPVGQTVGYRVRLERKVSANTRIEVVTEGILTRLLQEDPGLEGIGAILFDEFHERSLQADLGLALALDAQTVLRPDLRLLIMSATLDAAGIGQWLDAPVIRSLGRMYPVETHYLSPAEVAGAGLNTTQRLTTLVPKAIRQALTQHTEGDVLVFLPGMGEIKKVAHQLENGLPATTELHLLHGELSLAQQTAAIQTAPPGTRKVVLATSIAETSLTIQGVRIVVDGGFARVPRFVQRTGLTTLATVPVSQAAADQRRGRAGRLGPGICYRLWTTADQLQLPPQLPPEIREADLSSLTLELAIWGVTDVSSLRWLDVPPAPAVAQAVELLKRLEAIDKSGKPTAHGRALASLGLEPRLGHLVVQGNALGHGATACALAAMLAERDVLRPLQQNTGTGRHDLNLPDLRLRLELLDGLRIPTPGYVVDDRAMRRIWEQTRNLNQRLSSNISKQIASSQPQSSSTHSLIPSLKITPDAAGLLTALAYPDRIAQRETSGRVRLISGQKAALPTELFSEAEFYAIAHLDSGANPRILLAAPLDKADLLEYFPGQIENAEELRWDAESERVSARQISRMGALVLNEKPIKKPDPEAVATLLFQVLMERGIDRLPWSSHAENVRQRLAFLHHLEPGSWPGVSAANLEQTAADWLLPHLPGLRSMAEVAKLDMAEMLLAQLSWEQRNQMDKLAPTHLEVPTGSRIALDYSKPETPVLAVRLQEVFGLLDTPRIANGKVPLLMHLLSPAHRPVQVTRDLRSFWNSGYFEVRKDLRGRYPKHAWPEDPLTAPPQRGVKRKS